MTGRVVAMKIVPVLVMAVAGCGQRGAGLYATQCAVCHGDDGSGGSGPDIRDTPFDALAPELRDDPTNHEGGAFPSIGDVALSDLTAFLAGVQVLPEP